MARSQHRRAADRGAREMPFSYAPEIAAAGFS